MLEYSQTIFYCEYLLVAYQLIRQLITIFSPGASGIHYFIFFLSFFALSMIKQKVEGLRTNYLLFVLNEALFYASAQLRWLHYPQGLISLLQLYLIYRMVVYTLPKVSGQFQVGHKYCQNEKLNLQFSIYYPTTNYQGCAMAAWLPIEQFWRKQYDNFNKDIEQKSYIPRIFFQIGSQYLHKLSLNAYSNAEIISTDQYEYTLLNKSDAELQVNSVKLSKMPAIVMSHGLSLHCNANSVLAQELASRGCFVLSVHHEEEIKNQIPVTQANRTFRTWQLKERFRTVQRHIDYVLQPEFLFSLFQKEVALDMDTLSIAGHSSGGTTAMQTAMQDARIKGACLCMDPCTYIIKDEICLCDSPADENRLKVPIISLCSDDFYWRLYPFFRNEEKLYNIYKNSLTKQHSLLVVMKNLSHVSMCDLSLLMCGELSLFKVIQEQKLADIQTTLVTLLLYFYEQQVILRDTCGGTKVPRQTLFENYIKQYSDTTKFGNLYSIDF